MKATLEIPDDLFREAKAKAALEGIKLKDLVTDAIRRSLEQSGSARLVRSSRTPGGPTRTIGRPRRTKFPLLRPGKRPPATERMR
jgi:hypothetical protein